MLAGAVYAIARNPLGCLIWLIIQAAVLLVLLLVALVALLSHPFVMLLLVCGIALIVYATRRPLARLQ